MSDNPGLNIRPYPISRLPTSQFIFLFRPTLSYQSYAIIPPFSITSGILTILN